MYQKAFEKPLRMQQEALYFFVVYNKSALYLLTTIMQTYFFHYSCIFTV